MTYDRLENHEVNKKSESRSEFLVIFTTIKVVDKVVHMELFYTIIKKLLIMFYTSLLWNYPSQP